MPKKRPSGLSVLEWAKAELGGDYTAISPEHNAIKLILADLGKGDLTPDQVEALCHTAKVPGINGFTRLDQLPCGCVRIYRGMVIGVERTPPNVSIRVGGVEGVKACVRHIELISGIQLREVVEQPRMF